MENRNLSLSCDFMSQADVPENIDVEHGTGYDQLVVKQNICYIVAGIIINERNEILMIQEAKPSCYGKWYLPAGRMEPNETILEGVKREVLEEAGLEFEPTSILCIEESGGCWIRIVVIGNAVGGKLKTTEQADEESLQAMWWNREDEIAIRCGDVLPLIDIGFEWKLSTSLGQKNIMPIEQGQSMLFQRILIVQLHSNGDYNVLLRRRNVDSEDNYCIPTSRIHPLDRSFYKAAECLLDEAVESNGDLHTKLKILGAFAIEHSGKTDLNRDGLAVSVLVRLQTDVLPSCSDFYSWLAKGDVPDKSLTNLLDDAVSRRSLVPLRSLKDKVR